MQITNDHIRLERRAVSAYYRQHNAPGVVCVGEAVEWYLGTLDPMSDEWNDWIDTYGEAELIRQYGVAI